MSEEEDKKREGQENVDIFRAYKKCVSSIDTNDPDYKDLQDECVLGIFEKIRELYIKKVLETIEIYKKDAATALKQRDEHDALDLAAKITEQEQLNADLLKVKEALQNGIFN